MFGLFRNKWRARARSAEEQYETAISLAQQIEEKWREQRAVAIRNTIALRDIIDQETPSANATVKRMARIAREALEQ